MREPAFSTSGETLTSTQSWVPSAWAALGVVKLCDPLLANGDPLIAV